MINGLINYVKSIFHTIKKEDVVKNLDDIITALNDDVIPTFDLVIKSADLSVLENSKYIKTLMVGTGIKYKDNRDALVKIKSILMNIVKANKDLENLVLEDMSDIVTDKTMTVQDAAILKLVSDIGNMTLYSSDFIYLVLLDGDTENTDYPKNKINNIIDNIPTYSNMLKTYGDNFKKFIANISKLPETTLPLDSNKSGLVSAIVNRDAKMVNFPMASGFNGNPIYHIRMWLVDVEIAKYEALKEKKKLVELKLMELKLNAKDESNPKIVKQIEYYENKLSDIEYKISKIEEE